MSAASYDQSELQYSQLLTPYASQFVREHINKSVCVQLCDVSDGICPVDHTDCVHEVSAFTGTCSIFGRVISGSQEVKLGLRYGTSLANMQADVGTAQFAEHLEVYKELEPLWQAGKRAVVAELEHDVPLT